MNEKDRDRRNMYITNTLSVAAAAVGGYLVGVGVEGYNNTGNDHLDRIVADLNNACDMQAEVEAIPGGLDTLLPAWEKVRKVIREDGKFYINLPGGSAAPQEIDPQNPTPGFEALIGTLSHAYVEKASQLGRLSEVDTSQVKCDPKTGELSLNTATNLTAADRKDAENALIPKRL